MLFPDDFERLGALSDLATKWLHRWLHRHGAVPGRYAG